MTVAAAGLGALGDRVRSWLGPKPASPAPSGSLASFAGDVAESPGYGSVHDSRSARRRRGRGGGEQSMVPPATFTSYYGRQVVKPSPWEADIPAYLFFGGLAAGSSLLAAGADLTGRDVLRRTGRLGALGAVTVSLVALVHDLGRPGRFLNMLRVAKLTSPMSVGTWILSAYGPLAALAATAEVVGMLPGTRRSALGPWLPPLGRASGVAAAVVAPAVAAYTAVLLADTATPSWHDAYRELPFVFVGSASAAAGGLAMIGTPPAQATPARRLAVAGAVLDLVAERVMESSMGLSAEPLHQGQAGTLMKASLALTVGGALGTVVGGRNRFVASVSGAALMAGSVCTRFGVFEAGQASARDPKYTVVPQRERLQQGRGVRHSPRHVQGASDGRTQG
jgi:formate-dependent nitrite reductase membrane component NrfD